MFSLSEIVIPTELLRLQLENPAAGACVIFEGWVRDHQDGREVLSLDYEAFAPLAIAEGEGILHEAMEKFEIIDARCVHRIGQLEIGDLAVWTGVSATHRGDAFTACEFIIDEVKRRVPIWKNEHYADGTSAWVNAPASRSPIPPVS
jgi:molybdopterin synthase catalytic subunit